MYPVSDEFLRAVKHSHNIDAKVEVYDGTDMIEELRVSGGNVSLDRDNANRRRCNVRIDGADYTPRLITDLLHPSAGHELKMYRGVVTGYESYDDPYSIYSRYDYAQEILSSSPVGYWRLSELSGLLALDSSGNGHDGTYINSPTLGVEGALIYDEDTAVNFDAEGDHFSITNPKTVPGAGSIAAWVHTGTWEDLGQHGIFQNVPNWANSANFVSLFRWAHGSVSDSAPFYFRIVDPAGTIQDLAPPWANLFVKQAWNYIVATWDATHMRVYVNGEEKTSRTYTPPNAFPGTGVRWAMGHQYTLRGLGDEFALYDRALTADEIAHHYKVGRQHYMRETIVARTSQREIIEYVPLGVFNIEDTDLEDTGEEIKITVKGFDRSKDIQRRRFTDIYTVARGTKYTDAIRNMIDAVYPGLTYNFPNIDYVTPQLVFGEGGGDRWDKALDMAQSIGHELFFDPQGALELRPEPDASSDPVDVEYKEGPESVLLYVTRDISREDMFNHVIAIGNHSDLDQPIRADAQDNDPNSPTYVGGPFGDVPTWIKSTMIRTQAQAQEVADAQLRRKLGTPERIRFISIVNPAHDIGDVVRVERYSIGVQSTHVLDSFNIPLDYTGSINATARERRV